MSTKQITADAFENRPLLADPLPSESNDGAQDALDDDIPESPLPLSMCMPPVATVDPGTSAGHAAIHVDTELWKMSQHVSMLLAKFDAACQAQLSALDTQAHHHTDAAENIARILSEAVTHYDPVVPYAATVHVLSPSGFVMQLNVQNGTREGFLAEMGTMMQFLTQNQFTPYLPPPF